MGASRAAADEDRAHTVIDAGDGRAATEAAGARWVKTVLGNVKRSSDGTYHAFGFLKHSERYLAKTHYRSNRRFDVKAMLQRLLAPALRDAPAFTCSHIALITWE